MSKLLKKIRSRGYWRVVIHPATFTEKRIAKLSDLYPILQKTSVQFRVWDFPHLSSEKPQIDVDWIGQEIDWENHVELWRFYQSGQFVHLSGMREDWLGQARLPALPKNWKPGVYLSITNVLFHFTEIFEFAARLAFTKAGDEQMRLEVMIHGLEGRTLWVDPSAGWGPLLIMTRKASIKESLYKADLARIQLVTEPKEMALKASVELFQGFGWNPSLDALRDMQDELLHKGSLVTG